MFWRNKNKDKNKILISFADLNHIGLDMDLEDLIVPVKGNYPTYWKDLRPDRMAKTDKAEFANLQHRFYNGKDKPDKHKFPYQQNSKGRSTINVLHCPSFVEIFKNSFLIKAPCDIMLDIDKNTSTIKVFPIDEGKIEIQRHSLRDQLWGDFNHDIINVKFSGRWSIKTTTAPARMIFMDPVYWGAMPYRCMPGVLPVVPNREVSLNLNVSFDKKDLSDKHHTKLINKGDVLSMVYMPDGLLEFEKVHFFKKGRMHFVNDYIKTLKEWKL